MIDTQSTILHPPDYRQRQIAPALRDNELKNEVVWTYLVAKRYENNQSALVRKLCGVEEQLPEDPKIYLEAYLHPTRIRMEEWKCWRTRGDLTIGCLELVKKQKIMIQAVGEWVCVVESKFDSDIRPNRRFPYILQLSQLIEHALLLHERQGIPPERVYVILVTPRYYTHRKERKYWQKYHDYTRDPATLEKDLKLCPLPYLEHDESTLLNRIKVLKLRWVTFEELLDLDMELASPDRVGNPQVNFGKWEEVFKKMEMLDVYRELIEETPFFNCPEKISATWDFEALQKVDKWLRQKLQTLPVGQPIHVGHIARESRKIQPAVNGQGVRYLLGKLHEEGYVDCVDERHFVINTKK